MTSKMPRVIILAAGRGRRLLLLTRDLPKSLLKVGDKSILEHILDRVAGCGITEVTLVVGFKANAVKDRIDSRYNNLNVKYVLNPIHDKTNNIYSLWLAKEDAVNGFILINGDDLFNINILRNLLTSDYADAAVIDDSTTDLPEEAMKVTIEKGFVRDISKTIVPQRTHGDAIGIYKFSPEGSKKFFQEIKGFMDYKKVNVFYLAAMQQLVKHFDLGVLSTSGLTWTEVDDHDDLNKAQELIHRIELEERNG